MKLLGQALKISSLNLVISAVGFGYSIIRAKIFGVNSEVEAYFTSLILSSILLKVVQTGQVLEVILPKFLSIRESGKETQADNLYSYVINLICVVYIIASVLICATSDQVLSLVLDETSKLNTDLVLNLLYIQLLINIPVILSSVYSSMLNGRQIYGKVEYIYLVSNIVNLICLIALADKIGVYSLVLAQGVSGLAGLCYSIYLIRSNTSYKYRIIWYHENLRSTELKSLVAATSSYVCSVQFVTILLTKCLLAVGDGYLALFKHIESVYARISMLITKPISVIFFTELNLMLQGLISGTIKMSSINKISEQAIKASMLISAIFLCGVIAFGESALTLLFSDQLPAEKHEAAYFLLITYFTTLCFMGYNTIFRKICVSICSPSKFYRYLSGCQIIYVSILLFTFKVYPHNFSAVYIFLMANIALSTYAPFYLIEKHNKSLLNFTVSKYFICLLLVFVGLGNLGQHIITTSDSFIGATVFVSAMIGISGGIGIYLFYTRSYRAY